MELAIREDFRDFSSSVDESVNKVGKFNFKQPPDDCGVCFRCGQRHLPSFCWFKTVQCYNCQKRAHMAKMCSSQKRKPSSTHYVEDVSQVMITNDVALQVHGEHEMVDLGLNMINSKGKWGSGYQVQLWLEGKQVIMEVDKGSAVFHSCLYGRKFKLITDHKPLVTSCKDAVMVADFGSLPI